MQVYGTTGYLGECELSSIVSEQTSRSGLDELTQRKKRIFGAIGGEACRLVPRRSAGSDRSSVTVSTAPRTLQESSVRGKGFS